MNQPVRAIKQRIIFSKPLFVMNEDFKNEFQLVVSGLQRLDSKIDSFRSEIKNDPKLFATKSDLLQLEKKIDNQCAAKDDLRQCATRDDLKQFATKDDLKQFATKDDLKQFATKDDLKQFATKDDLRQFATKDDLKQFATKDDLFGLEERNDLRYASKDNLAQTKYDLIKWMFTFSVSLAVMILGLYLKK